MIRNVIKATLFFAVVVSACTVAQVATALDLGLGDLSSIDPHHPYAWTPDMMQQRNSQNFSAIVKFSTPQDSDGSEPVQRRLSLQVYQGDGLDDLRQHPEQHSIAILPEEDAEAYGVSVKQRF